MICRSQIFILFILFGQCLLGQEGLQHSAPTQLDSVFRELNPEGWAGIVEKKLTRLENRIIKKSQKTLHRLQKQEEEIWKKQFSTKDSIAAKLRLAEIQNKYKAFQDKLKKPAQILSSRNRQYIASLDTLKTAFNFLDKNDLSGTVKDVLVKAESFEGRLQQAEEIKKFIRERKEQLKRHLDQLGITKDLKRFNQEIYYYGEQLKEYKAILKDPKKIERKALELLSKTKEFKEFFRKNSMIASLVRVPITDPNDPSYLANLAGLQTRLQVRNLIQQQIAAGGPSAMAQVQQNLQQAQTEIQQLKNKIFTSGGNSNTDIPDFKPNSQKTKSFLQRLELGTNIQSQKPNRYFPVTTDFGLSLGYKLNDKSIIGIGTSYKLGWGQNIRNINITHEGVGLRSFADWKLKGSFWLSGGYEMNYQSEFNRLVQLQNMTAWQKSGLLGLSKVVSVKSRFFKKTKLQLLWDFLSYDQEPRTQPILFRIGYNL